MKTAMEMIVLLDGALGYDRGPEHVRSEDALVEAINTLFARLAAQEAALVAADAQQDLLHAAFGGGHPRVLAYDEARRATKREGGAT